MSERVQKAQELFYQGYNCSQAVFGAYADIFGVDFKTALKLSAGLGGGCGRQRELCGAVSGAVLVIGLKYGSVQGDDQQGKKLCYEKVRAFSDEFKKVNRSIICRELLGIDNIEESSTPNKRDEQYYKKRPCAQLVKTSAEVLENFILKETL